MNHTSELGAHSVICAHQRTHVERTRTLGFEVRLARRDHRTIDGSNIGRVEVDPMIHYGEVRADAEWVAARIQGRSRWRRLDRAGEPGGRGRYERTTSKRHDVHWLASYALVVPPARGQRPRIKRVWSYGAGLAGRQMRALHHMREAAPAASGHCDRRGELEGLALRPGADTPRRRMLCGWRCRAQFTAGRMREHASYRTFSEGCLTAQEPGLARKPK